MKMTQQVASNDIKSWVECKVNDFDIRDVGKENVESNVGLTI